MTSKEVEAPAPGHARCGAAFEARVPAASDLRCCPNAVAAFCRSVAAGFRKQRYYDRVTFASGKSVPFCVQVVDLLTSKGYAVSHTPVDQSDGSYSNIIEVGLWETAATSGSTDAAAVIHPTVLAGAAELPHVSHLQQHFLKSVATECVGITDAFKTGSARFRLCWKGKSASFCAQVEDLMRRKGYGVRRENDGRLPLTLIEMPSSLS